MRGERRIILSGDWRLVPGLSREAEAEESSSQSLKAIVSSLFISGQEVKVVHGRGRRAFATR